MLVNDPIADMLTRIRNAQVARHDSVTIPASNMKKAIAKILLDEGYVKSVENVVEDAPAPLQVTLTDLGKKPPVVQGLRRISKPGPRVYAACEDLPKVLGGLGIAIVSTNRGIMTDRAARKENIGGEVLCYVW